MNHYMIELKLPNGLTEEFVSLIPEQRTIADKMMARGAILSYSLAVDRSKLWIIMSGPSEEEVLDDLYRLPLTRFMDVHIQELSFHNAGSVLLSSVSMN